jgi:cyclopropane fatty-acyl-phospholipid synthase-like methyltransferase
MADYRDDFYERYAIATGHATAPGEEEYAAAARQFRSRWARLLPVDRTAPILELGCGAGHFVKFLRDAGYGRVEGVDRSAREIARAHAAGIGGVRCLDAGERLAGSKEEFETIVALNFFEHLRKDEVLQTLTLVFAALRPRGRLLVVTPNSLSPFGGATRYWDFSHETGFTPASWRQLARLTGFSEPSFEEFGPMPHSLPGAIRTVLWQAIRLALVAMSYVEVGGPRDPSWTLTADMKVILTKPGGETACRSGFS